MKWILGLCLFTSIAAFAEPLTIRVQNVRVAQGNINISFFYSAQSWDKETPDLVVTVAPVVAVETPVTIDLPPGQYGFFLYEDLDNDGELKQTPFGFPAEPYAFSNNVKIKFSKPSFASMAFTVAPGVPTEHVVQLQQP
jgi:uncharacterized protein (DUF2141 family)